MMSLSSNSCLKRIKQQVNNAGFSEVSQERIREACLIKNFDTVAAANQLIQEEQLKVSLEELCEEMGHNPNANIIINSCNKYKFETFQVERYVKKLLLGREELKDRCITANIVVSNEILDNKIILAFGNPLWAFNSVRQDHLCSQEHQ